MTLAVTHARILTGRAADEPTLGTVLIDGGTIADVLPEGAAFEADETVDVAGATVMPGLINAHGHVTMDAYDVTAPRQHNRHGDAGTVLDAVWKSQRALLNGVTTIRDCMTTTDGIWQLKRVFDAGDLLGPRLLLAGRAVVITGGHMHYIAETADGPEGFRAKTRKVLAAGADLIKIAVDNPRIVVGRRQDSLQMTVDEIRAVVDTAHDLGHRVAAHSVTREGLRRAIEAGVDSIEHGYRLDKELASQMADKGIWLVPTMSVPITLKATIAHDEESRRGFDEELSLAQQAVRTALAAGVRIAAGDDSGSPGNHIWDFATELVAMQDAGMSAAQVVEAATSGAAELLDLEGRVGRVEPGQAADLVIVEGRPDEDVVALRDVRTVVKDGRIVPRNLVPTR